MIDKHLNDAISILRQIIDLTNTDIANIKVAKHNDVGPHSELKTKLLAKFEKTKKDLDNELLKLAQANPGTNLSSLLSQESKDNLATLRSTLIELKKVNFEYAKNVVVIKEFFDSLVGKMLGKSTNSSYTAKTALSQNNQDFFKATV